MYIVDILTIQICLSPWPMVLSSVIEIFVFKVKWDVSATGSLLPFLTIHMQSIGLTVEEIAIVYLALPLTTFLSPPVTGVFN